jgi:5'-3' exonuclease
MIIVDYSGIAIAAIFSQDRPEEIQEGLIRHMILNALRRYNLKYRDKYGKMIIACDSTSWRKEVFENYKAKRKTTRDESPLDWNHFFTLLNGIRDEIAEDMPYPVVHTDRAEADDVIATLVESTQEFGQNEPVMIISSDKDFIQLHRYSNVEQFSPMKRGPLKVDDPIFYKFDHICRGDASDGVPNVLSGDNAFVDGIRQSPMYAKKIKQWYEAYPNLCDEDLMTQEQYRNYCRNKTMIDLDCIPLDIRESIMDKYNTQTDKNNNKVLNYLITKRCNMLVESASEFFTKEI